jgi:tetratricopeptide (TPR) repeat protein
MMARAQQSTGTKPSSTQRQKLNEYVAALQTNPNDVELRQKIVKLAATLKPPPAIPEEARRYYVKAVTLQKQAKTAPEVAPAIAAYEQALLLAPWWADAYYNVSSALELAGRYP